HRATRSAVKDWLYEVAWRESEARDGDPDPDAHWIVLADRRGTGAALARSLEERRIRCTVVHAGASFAECADAITIDPASGPDVDLLLKAAARRERLAPTGIVHLWSLD